MLPAAACLLCFAIFIAGNPLIFADKSSINSRTALKSYNVEDGRKDNILQSDSLSLAQMDILQVLKIRGGVEVARKRKVRTICIEYCKQGGNLFFDNSKRKRLWLGYETYLAKFYLRPDSTSFLSYFVQLFTFLVFQHLHFLVSINQIFGKYGDLLLLLPTLVHQACQWPTTYSFSFVTDRCWNHPMVQERTLGFSWLRLLC